MGISLFEPGQEYFREELAKFVGFGGGQTGILYSTGQPPKMPGYVIVTSGGRHGKRVGYEDGPSADGTWIYFGQGREGNQDRNVKANSHLLDHTSVKLLFTTREPTAQEKRQRGNNKKTYRYEGAYSLLDWDWFEPTEGARRGDKLVRTVLKPVDSLPAVPVPLGEENRLPQLRAVPDDDAGDRQAVARSTRRGQAQFRKNMFILYDGRCAVTGTAVDTVLHAAHVWDHADSGINQNENGILVRADIHELFDDGLLRIVPGTLQLEVDESIIKTIYGKYHGRTLAPRTDGTRPSAEYLQEKYPV